MSRRSDANAPPPWWSEPGPEVCEFCLQAFHLEAGYHCIDCDRPICPVCVVTLRERRAVSCPQCTQQGQS